MNELFGISMSSIMVVMAVLFGLCVLGVLAISLANRTMFKMGLRNIPRRGAQTGLVIVGLMLATLIITAAFTTGDTIDQSITSAVYDGLQRTDLDVNFRGQGAAFSDSKTFVPESSVATLERQFQDDPNIDGFNPALFEAVPVLNGRTRLSEPAVLLAGVDTARLAQLGGLRLADGDTANLATLGPNDAFVSEKLADQLDAQTGDTITLYSNGQPYEVRVAGIVKDELMSGVSDTFGGADLGGMALPLATVQRITDHPGQVNFIGVALKGGVRDGLDRSDAAADQLQTYLDSDAGRQALSLGGTQVKVETVKQDAVETAELFGNIFTTFFLVLGLFSIAAGILLIFMIFVMLAAERKPEMGMARAVGAKRINLVQSFVAEGSALSIIAGAVGAALGVAAAVSLVVGLLRLGGGTEFEFISAHITLRSLVISYCLGVVITVITVVISSMRVSHLNIVAAIRGTEDASTQPKRRKINWLWVVLGIPAMVIPPLGIWWFFRKGLGLSWAWIVGPTGVVLGALLMLLGKSAESLFPFALGISLIPLSLASLARHYRAPNRATWTTVGALLAAYWLLPANVHDALFGTLKGDIEMFVLSGIMIVTSFTLLIVFNARFLTSIFSGTRAAGSAYTTPLILGAVTVACVAGGLLMGDRAGGLGQLLYLLAALLGLATIISFVAARFPRFGPALKMGVAYPLANRFRTGMTIAMFALIVFSLTTFSIINANFLSIFAKDGTGGIDVIVTLNRNNPVPDLRATLAETDPNTNNAIQASGETTIYPGNQEVRQLPGDRDWDKYPVIAADDAFFGQLQPGLDARARGYDSNQAVLEAVRTQPNLALVDPTAIQEGGFGGPYEWNADGVTVSDKQFDPFQVEVRDPVTGKSTTLTVVGVLQNKLNQVRVGGLYTNEATYQSVYGTPDYERVYLKLKDGVNAETTAKAIKADLVTRGVQAESVQKLLDDDMALNMVFTRMFQGFMGLGLLVGIAALGVIAFRSVVERRQQVGMLRAIGYQRGTVALTFLLESNFIALMGILAGVVGGAVLGRNLMTSDEFTQGTDINFFIPWGEVAAMALIAYVFSLLMTWWPSRGAASVPVAEALRYE